MLSGSDISGKIVGQTMTVSGNDAKSKLELKRTVRHSPTEGAKPPEGAAVLFDGTTATNFQHGTLTNEKNLFSEATSRQGFGDYTLHVEFRLTYMPLARGQGRSNSGVYLHNCYEIQVLDSFGLEGENNECGGFYQLRKPDVNMCFPPLTWQTYDVEFTAPRYQDGKKVADARVEVRHNGVVIHPEFALAARHARPASRRAQPHVPCICKVTATRWSSATSGSRRRSERSLTVWLRWRPVEEGGQAPRDDRPSPCLPLPVRSQSPPSTGCQDRSCLLPNFSGRGAYSDGLPAISVSRGQITVFICNEPVQAEEGLSETVGGVPYSLGYILV